MTEALNELEVVTLFVEDVASTGQFYTDVFGLRVVYQDDVSMLVRLGQVMLNLLHREQAPELVEPSTVAKNTAGVRALFTIRVADSDLADLRERLLKARWAPEPVGGGEQYGVSRTWMRNLVEYWTTAYDWRRWEEKLNRYPSSPRRSTERTCTSSTSAPPSGPHCH